MAKLLQLPHLSIINGFKGIVDFYYWMNIPVARSWPRKPDQPRTAAVQAQWPVFTQAVKTWNFLSPQVKEHYRQMTAGTNLTARDVFMKAYIKGMIIDLP